MKPPLQTVRVDRWLSAARFYKTRSQAAKACEGGKVKVNRKTAKPHKFLRVGDELTVHVHGHYRNLKVMALAQRGLPPKEARELYQEEIKQSLSDENEELLTVFREADKKYRPKFKGRPTKRERRELEKMKGKI